MAMSILSTRLASSSLPLRVCVASSSSMSSSSSSSSSTPASNSTLPDKKKDSAPAKLTGGAGKREGLVSRLFAGLVPNVKFEPADPNDEPIDVKNVKFPDHVDHASGESLLLLLALEAGYLDPYCNLPIERKGRGSKDNPVEIPCWTTNRVVACGCERSQNHLKFTRVYRDVPKRCQCGHWLKIVDPPKFWLDIPKEDLKRIEYFRRMDEEGKLDEFLADKGPLKFDHYHPH